MVEPITSKVALDALLKKVKKFNIAGWDVFDGNIIQANRNEIYKTEFRTCNCKFDVIIHAMGKYEPFDYRLAVLSNGLDVAEFECREGPIAALYSKIHKYHVDKRQKIEEHEKISREHSQKAAISDLEKVLGLDKISSSK